MRRSRCARRRNRFIPVCSSICAAASSSRSKPITAWFRPRIGAKASAPSMRSASRALKGAEAAMSDTTLTLSEDFPEIRAAGCNAGACHAQMYIMGTLLRHGSAAQKERYLPGIASGELRLQAFGVTEPTTGSDTTKLKTKAERRGDVYVVSGQKVWTSRALQSDLMLLLARTTPIEQVKRRGDGLSVLLVDLRQ